MERVDVELSAMGLRDVGWDLMAVIPHVADNQLVETSWGNAVADAAVHVFASVAERDSLFPATAPRNGSMCRTLADSRLWMVIAGVWTLIAGAMPRCSAARGSPQSLGSGTVTAVAWTAETGIDPDNIHDNATNPSRMTIPAGLAGLWRFEYFVDFAIATGGYRYVWLSIDSITTTRYGASGAPSVDTTHGTYLNGSAELILNAGQYVETIAIQDCGSALNVCSVTGARFVARYVGPA